MNGDYRNKKILVIGGASQHCKIVETAKKMGIMVYVADYLEDSPAKAIADVSLLIDVMDVEALVQLCKKENIDGAIATSLDACQIPYQKVCERMNYPCFGTAEQYYKLTNKQAFKACCTMYGVDTIPSYTIDDILTDNKVEYPIFIKPVDSRGSRGQSICYSRKDIEQAIEYAKKESSDGSVVIEKYMGECQDFTVSYLFANGEAIVIRTGDRFEGSKGTGLENLCIASCSPSSFTDFYLRNVNTKVVNMLKGIGIKNGPVFFQGFIDGGTVRFYDPGLRFAGGEYERILKEISGEDIIQLLVEYAISGKPIEHKLDDSLCKLHGKQLTQLDPTLLPGKIQVINGLREIEELECVISISKRVNNGDCIQNTNDLRQRFGEICIVSENRIQEVKNIKIIQKLLSVKDENGSEMIFDQFNAELLL